MRRLAWLVTAALAACGGEPPRTGEGDKESGRLLLRQFGCGSCHAIPGVADAVATTGPSLEGFGKRIYIAGLLPNDAANLARFIRDPRAVDPRTTMPNMGVGEVHARDMAAYLRSLR